MLTTSPSTIESQGGHAAIRDRPPVPPSFAFDVAVVGLGYVGLPTALAFHAAGQRVLGVDNGAPRLAAIRGGHADLLETDRQRLAEAVVNPDTFLLNASTENLGRAAAVLVCVPTPVDGHLVPDLAAITSACHAVVAHAVPGQTLLLCSTTYPGCTEDLLVGPLRRRGLEPGTDVFVAFAPERIDPGHHGHRQVDVPRVVGGVTPACTARASEILAGCASKRYPVSSALAAELTKLYENTFRAVNISLVNEFADISAELGLDVAEVIDAAATKPYGFMPFHPGAGVGGHCIPCDPRYLLWQLQANRFDAPMIEAAMRSVAGRPRKAVHRITEVLAGQGRPVLGARILVLGVAYKPGVGDVRDSPALEIIERLRAAGADVAYADERVPSITVGGARLGQVLEPAAGDWDLVVVHTVHPETDLAWLAGRPVLDTTYRLAGVARRAVL